MLAMGKLNLGCFHTRGPHKYISEGPLIVLSESDFAGYQ